jgi:hypothetical protein
MNRDMTHPMDAALATRMQGQLISSAKVTNPTVRAGYMTQIPGPQSKIRPATGLDNAKIRPLGVGAFAMPGQSTLIGWGVAAVAGAVLYHMLIGKRAAKRSAMLQQVAGV